MKSSKLSRKVFEQRIKEFKIMFKDENVKVTENDNKALLTVRTKEMILETHKEYRYFHGAILACNNYSIKAEGNELIIVFGFEIF